MGRLRLKRVSFLHVQCRLQVWKREGILQFEVYERVGKSINKVQCEHELCMKHWFSLVEGQEY